MLDTCTQPASAIMLRTETASLGDKSRPRFVLFATAGDSHGRTGAYAVILGNQALELLLRHLRLLLEAQLQVEPVPVRLEMLSLLRQRREHRQSGADPAGNAGGPSFVPTGAGCIAAAGCIVAAGCIACFIRSFYQNLDGSKGNEVVSAGLAAGAGN